MEWMSAFDDHAIIGSGDMGTHGGKVLYHYVNTVRFFDFQLLSIFNDSSPLCKAGKSSDYRKFIDKSRNYGTAYGSSVKGTRTDKKICCGFSVSKIFIEKCDIGSHILTYPKKSVSGRVNSHIFNKNLGTWNNQSGGDEVSGRGNVTRYLDFLTIEF